MSIAEKLTTIAEKMDEVYNAGVEAGKSQAGGGVAEGIKKVWDVFQQNGNAQAKTVQFLPAPISHPEGIAPRH